MPSLATILAIAGPALALTSPPSGALTVGSSGDYSTIQAAVDALDSSTSSEQTIFIYQGTYEEQVVVPAISGALTIYGYSESEGSYSGNTVTITAGKSQDDGLDNDGTATLAVHSSANIKVFNLNVVNSFGEGSQAVALSAYGTGNQGYYGVSLKGFQDTLLAQTGNQIYANSYIEGATDFIFGQQSNVWITGSDLRVASTSLGYVTANGPTSEGDSVFVINDSTLAAASGASVGSGAVYLGRPWREYAHVVFQNSELSDVVNEAGWSVWNNDDERTGSVQFGEYSNTGDGASTSGRASFSEQLSAAVDISDVLGSDYADWVDTNFL